MKVKQGLLRTLWLWSVLALHRKVLDPCPSSLASWGRSQPSGWAQRAYPTNRRPEQIFLLAGPWVSPISQPVFLIPRAAGCGPRHGTRENKGGLSQAAGLPQREKDFCVWEQNTAWNWLPTSWLGELSSLVGVPKGMSMPPAGLGCWKGSQHCCVPTVCGHSYIHQSHSVVTGVTEASLVDGLS